MPGLFVLYCTWHKNVQFFFLIPGCITTINLHWRRTLVLLDSPFSIKQPGSSMHKTMRCEV